MLQPKLPVSRLPLTENISYLHDPEVNYAESIRVFRRAFQRLMNATFLSQCCEDLIFIFEDGEGKKLKRNPSAGDLIHIENGNESGTFRITRAIYRSAVILEKEWYQLRAEQIAGTSSQENVISYFFDAQPPSFELSLIREGKLVYIRIDAPEELLPKWVKDEFGDKVLE